VPIVPSPTGTSASDIAVREDIVLDNSLIATSSSGSPGDNGALLSLLSVQNKDSAELGNLSVAESYGTLVGEVGFEVSSASTALQVGATLQIGLEQRRESVSGVNVDEELVDLMRYEQAFQAASEYISIINRLNDELLSIL
jgi:flagellar hook-associated protein 1 FlgK